MFLLATPSLKNDINVTILLLKNYSSKDVTFHKEEAYVTKPYLQGENLTGDNEIYQENLLFPILELNAPKHKSTQPSIPSLEPKSEPKFESESGPKNDIRFGKKNWCSRECQRSLLS